jgi:hypothetical protein
VTLASATSVAQQQNTILARNAAQGLTAILKVVKPADPDHHRQAHQQAPQPDGDAPRRRPEPVDMIAAVDPGRLDSQSE